MKTMNNHVSLIGNAGSNAEIRTVKNGKMALLNLATNEVYKTKAGERLEQTTWHRIVAWGTQAEAIEKLVKKGSMLAIDGKIVINKFETKTGEKRSEVQIRVNRFNILSKKQVA
jgi:single-strand DNA-binding protein